MRTYYVEVWENGSDYESGKSGLLLAVKATSIAHAEEVAMRSREFDVAEAC